jgi:hypothetical protein
MTRPVPLTKEPKAAAESKWRASVICSQGTCHMCRSAHCRCGCHTQPPRRGSSMGRGR